MQDYKRIRQNGFEQVWIEDFFFVLSATYSLCACVQISKSGYTQMLQQYWRLAIQRTSLRRFLLQSVCVSFTFSSAAERKVYTRAICGVHLLFQFTVLVADCYNYL